MTKRHGSTAARLAALLGMQHVYARANPSPLWSALSLGGRVPHRLIFEEGPAVLSISAIPPFTKPLTWAILIELPGQTRPETI